MRVMPQRESELIYLEQAARSRAAQEARDARKSKRHKGKQGAPEPATGSRSNTETVKAIKRGRRGPSGGWVPYRPGMGVEFYDSDAWRRVRASVLAAGKGICCRCGATRETSGKPMHVDHAYPRFSYPKLELDLGNLQVMCEPCNMFKKSRVWVSDWLRRRRSQLESGTT
jgi:5-methylcytosine-specific restriction endonuclease McrA